MSLEAILAAGTIVSYSTNLVTPAWIVIPGVISVGAIGSSSEAKQKTTLADNRQVYGAGLTDSPDKSIKGQHFGSDAVQKTFLSVCKAKTEMLIQVEFPDKPDPLAAGTGTIAEYLFKPLGFEIDDPSVEEWMMFTVNGKQNTDPVWTDPVTA